MNGLTLMAVVIVCLWLGYHFYGRWLEKTWGIDPNAKTPEPFAFRDVLFQGQTERIRTGIYHRNDFLPGTKLDGPAILEQMDTTIVIPPDWSIETDGFMNLRATYHEGGIKS